MNPVASAPAPATTLPLLSVGPDADAEPGVGFDVLLRDATPAPTADATAAAAGLLLPLLPGLPVFAAPTPGSSRPGDPTPPRALTAGPWGTELGVQVTVLAWERGEVDTQIASWIDELAQPAASNIPPDVEAAAPEAATATGPLPPAVFDEDEPTHPRLGRSAPAPGAPVSPAAEPTRDAPAAEPVLAAPAPAAPSTLAAPLAAAEQVAEAAVPSAEPARDAPTTRRRPGAARTWSPEDAAQVAAAGTPPVAAGESVATVESAPAPVPAASTADRAESWVPGRLLLAVEDGSGAWEMDLHRHHGVMDLVLRGGDDLGLLVRDHWRELREALAAPGERPGEIRHELLVSATAAPDAGASGREGADERGAFERWRSVIEAHDAAPVGRAPANLPADVGATRLVDRRL